MKPSLGCRLMPRLLIVAGALLMSCTPADAPTAVRAVSGVRPQSDVLPTVLSVADNDRVYTLDLQTNLFTTSDGVSATLDSSVTLTVATMMQAINGTDPTAASLGAMASEVVGAAGGCTQTGTCMTLRAAGDTTPSRHQGDQRPRVKPFHLRIRRGGPGSKESSFSYADSTPLPLGPLAGDPQRPFAPRGPRLGAALLAAPAARPVTMAPSADFGIDPCSDVLNAALGATRYWADIRTTPLSHFAIKIRDFGLNYVTHDIFSALGLDVEGLDLLNAQIAVGVLAFYWNGYNCWSRWAANEVTGVSVIMLWPGESWMPTLTKTCHYETWWFTFNEVQYFAVDVNVCEIDYT